MGRKPKEPTAISAKPNKINNDHVARLRVVQEVSSRNSSASWNSSCTFSTEQSLPDQPRPPVYNVEDYAGALRRFGRRGPAADGNNHGDGGSSEPRQTEMTLKEFTSATELLEKLKADLKLAYFSFVQEFVGDPIDGVTLLLELLKTVQQNGTQTKCTPANQRRVALDENSCLQCLKYCLRCQDAARKLAISPAGLYTLAACIMSTVNHSRLLTLELLTKACCESGTADGHNTVSDAMSTMRLRFAEPVRFRFLVGMMSGSGGSGMELLLAGLKFINAFTETCPDLQTKFYVQAELKQAGFKPAAILKNISNKSPLLSSVSDEIYRWQKNFINVESLKRQHDEVVREAKSLRDKVMMLEKKIHLLQEEKRATITSRTDGALQKGKNEGGGNSAEDEGISSSEQDDCDEDAVSSKKTAKPYKTAYSGQQQQQQQQCGDVSTVEEVLEDFDKVINDVSCVGSATAGRTALSSSASSSGRGDSSDGRKRYCREFSEADDAVIVPARIVPEPPRRSRSLFVNKNFEVNPFFEDDEEESADSDLGGAYDDDDEDDEDDDAAKRLSNETATTFRSVQNQIKRFSALARGDEERHRRRGAPANDHDGRRKSVYDVFGKPTAVDGLRPVTRSVSTRNVGDTAGGSRIPVTVFDARVKSERSVYLPSTACGGGEPKTQFRVARALNGINHNSNNNNAGLYSGYDKDRGPSSNGPRTLQQRVVNLSASAGKLTDFPSGLY